MKYLVLGSEGQIGGGMVDYLKGIGKDVIKYDIKRSLKEDLRNKDVDNLYRVVSKSDFVYFLAWDVGGSKYLKKKENDFEFINNNVSIMSNVFSCLKNTKKPFIFTSSQLALMVESSYGNTKLMGEKFAKSLNGITVRLWNVFGCEKEEEKAHVITDFIKMALTKGHIHIVTTGKEKRQFLYVKDCCEALYFLSINYEKFSSNIVDISSYQWVSIEDVAKIVSHLCQVDYTIGQDKDIIHSEYKIEPNKMFLEYWKPEHSLVEGIEQVLIDMKNQI